MVLAEISRRRFLVTAGAVAGVSALRPHSFLRRVALTARSIRYSSRLHPDRRDQTNGPRHAETSGP
jgi:hypothetical protein